MYDFTVLSVHKAHIVLPLRRTLCGPKGTNSPQHSTMKIPNTRKRKTNQPGETESLTVTEDAPCEHLMKPAVSSLITPNGFVYMVILSWA